MQPYYESRGVSIYLGDCRELLAGLPDASADLILTDPPYSAKTHSGARSARHYGFSNGDTTRDLITFAPIGIEGIGEALAQIGRIGRAWSLVFMDYMHIAHFQEHTPAGLKFVRFGMWNKTNGAPQFTGDRPAQGWEGLGIFHRAKHEGRMRWNGGGKRAVWTYPKAQPAIHPSEKPVALVTDLLNLFSNPGDLVLDPFMGSGSTLHAAREAGRRAIGFDISERWCEVVARRLAAPELTPALRRELRKLDDGGKA